MDGEWKVDEMETTETDEQGMINNVAECEDSEYFCMECEDVNKGRFDVSEAATPATQAADGTSSGIYEREQGGEGLLGWVKRVVWG